MTQKERNSKAKDWLWRYRDAKRECVRLHEELDEFKWLQESARAIRYTGEPGGNGNISDLSDLMVRREAIEERLKVALGEADQAFGEIASAVAQLPKPEYRQIMSLRYISINDKGREKTWDEIADTVGYSRDYICHVHGDALMELSMEKHT